MTEWTVRSPQRLTLTEPVRRLDIRLVTGRLNVVGTDGPARIEVNRVGRSPIVVEERDGRIIIRNEKRWGWWGLAWLTPFSKLYGADISVAVPTTVAANLRLIDGPVVVSGLRGSTAVEVTSGRITLMGVAGRTTANLVSGPVEALGVAGDLTMETVSGELILADSKVERVRAHAISGSITCDLDNPRRSEIRLSATSGSVTVRVREDSDLTVHLHTTSGRITSAFPQLDPAGGYWAKESRGVLGTGEGRLWASSTSGSVSLLARPAGDEPDGLSHDDLAGPVDDDPTGPTNDGAPTATV